METNLTTNLCTNLKRSLTAVVLILICHISAMAGITVGKEYYIWLNIYEKLLGTDKDGTGPALSAFGTNQDADSYVFIAESSGTDGYVLLRQKSSNLYLAASNANSYSMVLDTRATDSSYLWAVDEGTYTYLINKKNGKYIGVDGANKNSTYVSVYYDKPKGSHSQFSVIPTAGGTWDEARQAYESEVYTNAQGVKEIDYCQLKNKNIDSSDAIDIHITANEDPILGSTTVNLGSEATWLVFDNILPTVVIGSYMKYIKINGKTARNGSNCRVAIYLNGAVVIPTPSTVMECTGTNGHFTLAVGNHTNLDKQSNSMTNFTLRRGHIATLASGTNGSGYSCVYVADHADLNITLPKALNKRVSSVNIKQWQYLSKKGWGNTGGSNGGPQLRATWYWSWNAAYNSTTNMEFVPCRQHLYWPSASEVNSHTTSASISINEPEHSEQHESEDCSCGGTISEWTCYTINSDFLPSGGRIGSPQPTDLGFLTNFCNYVDNMQSRCDFTVTHAYWDLASYDETSYANWFCNTKCKSVWNNTGRPLWLSEMEISASWNGTKVTSYEQNRKYLQVLLQKIEESPWIERYAIYGSDMWQTYMFYDANPNKGLTPAGQVYRDHRSTFAYNSKYTKTPTFWTPSVKTPTLDYSIRASQNTITFTLGNTNGDCTESLVLQRKAVDGDWEDLYSVDDRSAFDNKSIQYVVSLDSIDHENDTFRVYTTTIFAANATSDEVQTSYITNPNIVTNSKSTVPGWTCERNAMNGYTKADTGDTYLEVWGPTATAIDFDYHQDVTDIPNGVYKLSAVCFNSSNGETNAYVNGNVGLYAVADGIGYFTPVTTDSEIDYGNPISIDTIIVRNGTVRIGIRNIGQMTARWAGADNFTLKYLGTEENVLTDSYKDFIHRAELQVVNQFHSIDNEWKDASGLIANPDCSRNTTDRWTVSNQGTNQEQAWDGDNDNNYFDKWSSGMLTSSMQQTIAYLPVGEYTLSAMLRCSTDQIVTLKAIVTSNDSTATYETSITGTGDQTIEGSAWQRGWEKATTPVFIIKQGDQLTIFANFEATLNGCWWSADHFQLSFKPTPYTPDVQPQPQEYRPEDIDEDGKITVSDITTLINIYLGEEEK
ncbi:MAG: RICIN domain-containing protein [Bacteroidaceae bacterium]|nr:RICIN domain-containing protein [Bacteroidaceae bacterium]